MPSHRREVREEATQACRVEVEYSIQRKPGLKILRGLSFPFHFCHFSKGNEKPLG